MDIARLEGFRVQLLAIEKVLESVNGDIRQALNLLQLWRSTSNELLFDQTMKNKLSTAAKNIDHGPFDVAPKFFHPQISIGEKLGLFYVDSSLTPLLVYENYLGASKTIEDASAAIDSIADGDLFDVSIRQHQNWELSNSHAVLSAIRPAALTKGYCGRVNFPT